MNSAQHILYHGTLVPLQTAITTLQLEIEDLKKEIRDGAEEGGDLYYLNIELAAAEQSLVELQVDLQEANSDYDELDG